MCGDCWLEKHLKWFFDGSYEFRPPVMMKEESPSICCFCGNKTKLGIFVREDPIKLQCIHKEE
jgi:hypothetical protein